MCTSGLHHVEICVGEENDLMNLLIRGFGFKLIARQITPLSLKWAVKHGSAVFVITRRKHHIQQNGFTDEYSNCDQAIHEQTLKFPLIGNDGHSNDLEHWTVFCCQNQTSHVIDSAFNVALVVNDVDEVTKRVKAQGGNVVREPTVVKDGHGQVRYSIVTSCFGNVVHTLIDRQDYSGEFLPGFERLQHSDNESKRDSDEFSSNNSDIKPCVKESSILNQILKEASTNYSQFWSNNDLDGDLFTHIDHVAYVCESGKSKELMRWYECCFGAKRFEINREDTEEEGFMLRESVINMRLKAMEYWRCAEAGLTMPSSTSEGSSLKIVIAESLNGNENSQVSDFLQAHQGPGVQHIALHSPNIGPTVKHVSQQGVTFRKAPPTYYQEGIRLEDIKAAGHGDELDVFQELGILLDPEDDVFSEMDDHQGKPKYLLQLFTTPIFQENTFFLEVIHRQGATGFGGGNIKALAQSVVHYKQQQKGLAKTSNSLPS